MQNSQQPTPSHQKYSNKQQGTFKKWLPAIALAVVIHALLLIVFFNSQKKSVPEPDSSTDTIKTSEAPVDLEHEKEVLLTLIEERSTTEKKVADEGETDEKSENKTSDDEKDDESTTQSETDAKKEAEQKESAKNDDKNAKSEPTKTSARNRTSTEQQSTNMPVDNVTYMPQPQGNPNDAVLLPRDLPQAELNPRVGNNQYANTAEQSQDANDQLSNLLNDVKEQKLREIQAQQQASKAAYLKSQPAAAPTKPTELASDSSN
ncbi:hypothetical protein [Psychrobacter sanguinis]|uniref:hypothetical protein n=1 Tax=Psychrobacter sanguinis TaxID=861445 RepID=UPI00020C98AC|nr:hypothetical protein [Psychrobacter sanguinis]EGK09880.1 hypothetical protein HMPREF9373_2036 [Psychrobacter sp. 1501(2011)]MCD9152485.1 hypothetical protein [Psychrobacter sanguinis]